MQFKGKEIKGVRIVLPRKFRIIWSCFRCYEEISIKSVRRLSPKSLSATVEQRKRKSLAKRFQTSERFSERKGEREREEEGDKQAIRCLKPSVVEMQIVVSGGALSFYLSPKREWPSSKINFHRTSRPPLFPLNRITVLNSVRKYSVKWAQELLYYPTFHQP